jgi:pimeloyl-ACP methyl ester carboxylesterase
MSYTPRRIAEHQQIELRGLIFHVQQWRGSDATPSILLHGFADCGDTFQFLVDALPDHLTLWALDQRGFGRSQWPQDGYWFPDYFADLDALLETLSPTQPVNLIGHSMGGHVASMYAGIRPERVRRCINIEGFGLNPTLPTEAPDRYRQWLDQVREHNDGDSLSRHPTPTHLAEALVRRHRHLPMNRAEYVAQTWMVEITPGVFKLRNDPKHKRVNPTLYRHEEVLACRQGIESPLLLIGGEESEFYLRCREQFGESALQQEYHKARFALVKDAAHMLHWEQPEQVAHLIAEFLSTAS